MTVSTTLAGVIRNGDGVTTLFDFSFQATLVSQVKAALIGLDQQLTDISPANYTVTLNVGGFGGDVSFITAPANGAKLYLYRSTSQTQLVSVTSQQKYDPKVTEQVWDNIVYMVQELSGGLSRALLVAPGVNPADLLTGIYDSAAAAATSAAQAEAAYDSFDDRYLGAKSANPALDNDGNPLLTGALYFNTVLAEMRVYTGAAWVAAYASLGSALVKTNNLSDLSSTPAARTNLGLVPQTSAIDTTAGCLLLPGAFGLGATGAPPTPANIDSIGAVRPTGWWTITAATLGTFPEGAADGLLLVEAITATFARQTLTYRGDVAVVGGRSYVRSRLGGSVWGAWQRIITMDAAGAADGDMLARVGGAWVRVPPGTDGQLLRSAGAGVAPVWGATLVAPGAPPVYACRAWVNFNGTGTVAIRNSGNVASITDNGTGNYTVNFVTAMPHANYSVCCDAAAGATGSGTARTPSPANFTTTSFSLTTHILSNGSATDVELCLAQVIC